MKRFIKQCALGQSVLEWLKPYPVKLVLDRPSEHQPALITAAEGQLTFSAFFGPDHRPSQTAWMLVHDIAHAVAAPEDGFFEHNIGLWVDQGGGPQCPELTNELIEMEHQVFTHQIVLLRHFDYDYKTTMSNTLRVAKTLFKVDPNEVWARADATTYEGTLAAWERKIALLGVVADA